MLAEKHSKMGQNHSTFEGTVQKFKQCLCKAGQMLGLGYCLILEDRGEREQNKTEREEFSGGTLSWPYATPNSVAGLFLSPSFPLSSSQKYTGFHKLTCMFSIFTSFLLICQILVSVLLLLCSPSSVFAQMFMAIISSFNTDLCNNMSAAVLEMLSRPGEEGFPDLVTVMRNLSTDSGMPPLPPGGGLASK